VLNTWISISGAHFSAVETETDFFNRIGRFLPVATIGIGSIPTGSRPEADI